MFFGLFKKKRRTAPEPQFGTAPRTDIHYHPELVERLKEEHKELLALCDAIQAALDQDDYPLVSKGVSELRNALRSHLMTENLLLYVYLTRGLAGDELNAELIRGFRHEMDGIGKAAMKFLNKYEAIGVDEDLAGSFATEFAAVGQGLGERIEREETVLYPLYRPSY